MILPKPTCRIGKVILKKGHEEPGEYGKRIAYERGCWPYCGEAAYFWRISPLEWKRVTMLEHVRRLR